MKLPSNSGISKADLELEELLKSEERRRRLSSHWEVIRSEKRVLILMIWFPAITQEEPHKCVLDWTISTGQVENSLLLGEVLRILSLQNTHQTQKHSSEDYLQDSLNLSNPRLYGLSPFSLILRAVLCNRSNSCSPLPLFLFWVSDLYFTSDVSHP